MTELNSIAKWLTTERKDKNKLNIDYILDTEPIDTAPKGNRDGILLIDINEFIGFKGDVKYLAKELNNHFAALQQPIVADYYRVKKHGHIGLDINNKTIIREITEPAFTGLEGHTIEIRHLSKIEVKKHQLSKEYVSLLTQTISNERENLKNRKQKEFYENIKEYHKIYENKDIEDIEMRSNKIIMERKSKDSWI
jgi:hypothetical protein